MEETDVAYLAGIIEAWGAFVCLRAGNSDNYYFSFSINTVHKEIINKINDTFGGTVKDYRVGRSIRWKWMPLGEDLLCILELCVPYLLIKKKLCEITIKFRHLLLPAGNRGRMNPTILRERLLLVEEFEAVCKNMKYERFVL